MTIYQYMPVFPFMFKLWPVDKTIILNCIERIAMARMRISSNGEFMREAGVRLANKRAVRSRVH